MQPWAWRVGIPVAGSGCSGLLLAVRDYLATGNLPGGNTGGRSLRSMTALLLDAFVDIFVAVEL